MQSNLIVLGESPCGGQVWKFSSEKIVVGSYLQQSSSKAILAKSVNEFIVELWQLAFVNNEDNLISIVNWLKEQIPIFVLVPEGSNIHINIIQYGSLCYAPSWVVHVHL